MKRKRGGKKGKAKKQKVVADVNEVKTKEVVEPVNVEESSGEEEEVVVVEEGKNGGDSKSAMEVDTPSESAATAAASVEQIEKKDEEVVAALVPLKPAERKVQVVYGRVRVKLKSKPVESVPSSSGGVALVEAVKISDKGGKEEEEGKSGKQEEGKSGQEARLEKEQVVTKEKEDLSKRVGEDMDSLPDIMLSALGNVPKKGGSLKTKSFKGTGVKDNVASKNISVVEQDRAPKALKEQKVEKKDLKNDKQVQKAEKKDSKDGETEQRVEKKDLKDGKTELRVEKKDSKDGRTEKRGEKKDLKSDKQEKMAEKKDLKDVKPEQRVEKMDLKTDKQEQRVEKKDLKDGKEEERLEKKVPKFDKPGQRDLKLEKQEQMMEKEDIIYDKQELVTALEVIGKVMKMDAAEPFNAPVDPMALGIPDYFDFIDTPMDFGTICSNIQSGAKYKNSEDVLKDVQYIWENCFKYNNKGDYVVDLMKRVKKNFTKHWQAAGLFSNQVRKSGGTDGSSQVADGANFSHGKNQVKSGSSKTKMKKKSSLKCHKDGCLCAICVLKQRRIEKEGKDMEDLTGISESSMALDMKQEGNSTVESPVGGDTSSVPGSQDQDSDADMERKVEEPGSGSIDLQPISYNGKKDEDSAEIKEKNEEDSHYADGSGESLAYVQSRELVELAAITPADSQEDAPMQLEEDPESIQQRMQQEAEAKQKRIKMLAESFENPMLLELCGSLFPEDSNSIWHGPHSIVRKQRRAPMSSIHSAIESL